MKFQTITFFLLSTIVEMALAEPLTQEKVVKSSLDHYPLVLQSLVEVEVATGAEESARGAFDGKVKGSANSRADGFYSGDEYKGAIEKPFPFLNSRAYTGYRQSTGTFPDYEGKMVTSPRGESFFGVSVSLLRNSLIDIRRYNIKQREEDSVQAKERLRQIKVDVQTMALQAYWHWVIKGYEVKVYEELLTLAEDRIKGINRRIKKGDLAQIYAVENQQYIVKRKTELQKRQLAFQKATFYVSLFYRDANGNPQSPVKDSLPPIEKSGLAKANDVDGLYQKALLNNAQMKILGSKTEQAKATKRLGQNDMLPTVNVAYEWSQDYGDQDVTRRDRENRIMINVEVPFEYRKGRGKKREGQRKMEALEYKTKLMGEKLKVHINVLSREISTTADIVEMTNEQIEMARKLAIAEVRKFRSGASDLILVNLREENLAETKITNLEAYLQYQQDQAELRHALTELMY